jgi:hypothetical protein
VETLHLNGSEILGLPSAFVRSVCLLLALIAARSLLAQEADKSSVKANELSPKTLQLLEQIPVGPQPATRLAFFKGLDAGVNISAAHDSVIGWYNLVTPALSYTFSPHYSSDVSVSIYPYRLAPNTTATTQNYSTLISTHGDVGDTLLEGHAIFSSSKLRSVSTFAMGLPTGNRVDGLGAGKVTFNGDERLERYFGHTAVLVDLGLGDSSGLINRVVTEDDNSVGLSGQFQAGIVSWLPYGLSLQSLAYEELPLGDQKTYSTIYRTGLAPERVVTGLRVIEDNGFNTSLYIPVNRHVIVGGTYNRSLRLHIDTVSTGVTFVWKGYPLKRQESLIDRALREAESLDDSPAH